MVARRSRCLLPRNPALLLARRGGLVVSAAIYPVAAIAADARSPLAMDTAATRAGGHSHRGAFPRHRCRALDGVEPPALVLFPGYRSGPALGRSLELHARVDLLHGHLRALCRWLLP